MAQPQQGHRTQLYLVTPRVEEAERFVPQIEAAIGAGEIACVLLDIGLADEQAAKKAVRLVGGVVQPKGVALLVRGWPSIAARAGADGVHMAAPGAELKDALDSLKPERIVGVGGIRTRHDAMTVAETAVDYVMIGEPSEGGLLPELDLVVDRTQWWAELFEIPCVAYAPSIEAVGPLARAGADFVALGGTAWDSERTIVRAVADAIAAIGRPQ